MNQGTGPEELPAEVLDDVASVVGAEVALLGRLPGGNDTGAMRVRLAGGADAVLKAAPRVHLDRLDGTLRARRVVGHMRRRGYPTPAWLGVGATATHVWHLMDFVDAVPVPELTPSIVGQLMEIIESRYRNDHHCPTCVATLWGADIEAVLRPRCSLRRRRQ